MYIEVMSLCDAATEAQGKLNILGTFDTIFSQKLPAVCSHCAVALRVRFSRIEKGEHKIKLNLVDEDGKPILPSLETSPKVDFPADFDSGVMKLNIVSGRDMCKILEKIEFRHVKNEEPWDDLWFCEDAREKGFKVYVDTSIRCKHYVTGMDWSRIKK